MESSNGNISWKLGDDAESIDEASNDVSEIDEILNLPPGMRRLESQVSGHGFDPDKKTIGMLRESSRVILKSGVKQHLEEREIEFYEKLQTSEDPLYKVLSRLTPEYLGIREFDIMNRRVKFLALQDITSDMSEPCVMDIKIGRRTWDPLAGPEKRASEDSKYTESKSAYGFSITGFQVYDLSTGCLRSFKKDYGKKLNAKTVIEALEIFLNITPNRPACRDLVMMLLSALWKIEALFRTQKQLRFYSSSILIAYDSRRLRQVVRGQNTNILNKKITKMTSSMRSFSFTDSSSRYPCDFHIPKCDPLTTCPVSSEIIKTNRKKAQEKSKKAPSLRRCETEPETNPISMEKTANSVIYKNSKQDNIKRDNIRSLCRTHSYNNNFELDMIEMRENYKELLSELNGQVKEIQNWVRVSMIDFTHVFPAEGNSLDSNYLEGIENLIKILESFLEQ